MNCRYQIVWISLIRAVSVPSLSLSNPIVRGSIRNAERSSPRGSKKVYYWLINHDELSTCPRLVSLLLTTITWLCPFAKAVRDLWPLLESQAFKWKIHASRFCSTERDGTISRWKSELEEIRTRGQSKPPIP